MAKQDFFQSVRTAVRFLAPRVETDNPYTKPSELEQRLRGAAIWLTPKSVEGFNPQDFCDVPEQERESLIQDVSSFIGVAEAVRPDRPAKPGEVETALPRFLKIVTTVQKLLSDEWIDAANRMLDEACAWAKARQWPTQFFPRQISEDFIGTYELRKLVFAVQGSQLVLNPVGRFAPGADGMFDLAVLPVYESVMILRQLGQWHIHPLSGENQRREWSEGAFVETAEKLARLA